MSIATSSFLVSPAALGIAEAHDSIRATSISGQTDIASHAAMVSFMPNNGNSADGVVESTAVSVVEGQAITATAASGSLLRRRAEGQAGRSGSVA